MNYFIRLTIVGLVTLCSCVYDSDEIVFREIEPPSELPQINFINANFYGDTLFYDPIDGGQIIIDAGAYKVVDNSVSFGDEKIDGWDDILHTDKWPRNPTTNKMRLEVEIASNNSSLADQLGVERFKGTLNIIAKPDPNLAKRFISDDAVEGKLKLVWPAINPDIVQNYIIRRYNPLSGQPLETIETKNNWLIEELYVGNTMRYEIDLVDINNRAIKLWDFTINHNNNIELKRNANNQYVLTWPKSKYYSNIKEYVIHRTLDFVDPIELYRTSNLNDTSYTLINAKFGDPYHYTVSIIPHRMPPHIQGEFITHGGIGRPLGNSFHDFHFLAQSGENEMLMYYSSRGYVIKYNERLDKRVDSLRIHDNDLSYPVTTSSAKYLMTLSNNYSTLSLWESSNFKSAHIFQTDMRYHPWIIVSDEKTCMMQDRNTNQVYLFDLVSGKQIAPISFAESDRGLISANGKYILIEYPKYIACKLTDGVVTKTKEFDLSDIRLKAFDPLNSSILWMQAYHSKELIVFNMESETVITNKQLDYNILNIDFYSRKGLGYADGNLYVFSIDDLKILHVIPYGGASYYPHAKPTLLGNTIITQNGIKYELQ